MLNPNPFCIWVVTRQWAVTEQATSNNVGASTLELVFCEEGAHAKLSETQKNGACKAKTL